jgi:hypothetical protein
MCWGLIIIQGVKFLDFIKDLAPEMVPVSLLKDKPLRIAG